MLGAVVSQLPLWDLASNQIWIAHRAEVLAVGCLEVVVDLATLLLLLYREVMTLELLGQLGVPLETLLILSAP